MFEIFKKIFNSEIKEKNKILFFCGAGLSQESGLETFRGSENSLWNNYDINTVCNLKTFEKNKEIVFKFYNERKKEILSKKPNLAHIEIANIQKEFGAENVKIFTSNIDLLLEKAGCQIVIHVHEDITTMKCIDCEEVFSIGEKFYKMHQVCPACQSNDTKPGIIFFNEVAPKYKILRAEFEKTGPIIDNKITQNTKIFIGNSFAVMKPDLFSLKNSKNILMNVERPSDDISGLFQHVITKKATSGIKDVTDILRKEFQK